MSVAFHAIVGDKGDDGRNECETNGCIAARDERNAMRTIASGVLHTYRRAVSETLAMGQVTEHSYRPALQELVEGLGGDGVRAINEPSHIACGAPDFVVVCDGMPMGHIECKDVGAHLDREQSSEQMTRYRAGLPNLVLTDYLEFRWYADGELRETARLGHIDGRGRIIADKDGTRVVGMLFDAFFGADPPTIADPRELARRMASKAQMLRDGIGHILRQESHSGPLRELLAAYRKVLIADLSDEAFADLQAQTATYGLFAARCLHSESAQPFTRQSAVFADMTPFLRDMFGRIAGPGIDSRIAWIVDDLALLLNRADMASILTDFGRRSRREDLVVHFYQDFLTAYDPQLQEIRGVYYTPEPVVSYIVRSVDRLLHDRFGLADGLATVPASGEGHQVLILDPAAGTGTFLREVIVRIRETIEGKGMGGAWPDYVRNHLLPRLFGFELLMAPYVICHLKLALEIGEAGAGFRIPDGQRLGVFLTNTLEEPYEQTTGALFAHEIAQEAASANSVKRDKPVMVVLGNPPYSGHSANKGTWITGLINRYKRGVPELQKPGQAKWLSDDYVKFIRFAQWRIERTGEGVLGFITNHSYLDNRTFQGMRRSLMETFDEIRLLDLHGNARKKERAPDGGEDKNVFDIEQGVAIGLFVKNADTRNGEPARVFHADLWGKREEGDGGGKYGWLSANDVESTEWTEISPKPPRYLFVPRDDTLSREYEAEWSIPEIFSPYGDPAPGIVTTHDQFAISWTPDEAEEKVERFLATNSEKEARALWSLSSQKPNKKGKRQWEYDRAKEELSKGLWKNRIEPVLYRPFDVRTTVFDQNVAVHLRDRVTSHMLAGPNLGICIGRAGQVVGSKAWDVVFAAQFSTDYNIFRRGGHCLFPVYTYHSSGQENFGKEREPNFDSEFINVASAALSFEFVSDGVGNLKSTFGPEDVFHYIYAVLHSPEYRRRYADFLKSDFPHIPLTGNRTLFAVLVELGQRLAALHLMEAEGEHLPVFLRTGDRRVDKVDYPLPSPESNLGCVWINDDQCFEGVESETWEFTIGGNRPAEKWLEYRKNRTLSFDDVAHYRRLCAALAETRQIMVRIDEAIEASGGWPLTKIN